MSTEDFLRELRQAVAAGCPVTVETITTALERAVEQHSNDHVVIGVLRGSVKPR